MNKTIALITGGNAGIGRATAHRLSEKGYHVVIAGRNSIKLKATSEALTHATGHEVDWMICDLNSLQSVRAAAAEFSNRYDRLDVLINNAGIIHTELELSEDGFEKQFAVNHLSHFLLTTSLLPLLEKSKQPRIVNVSSAAHYKGDIDFDNLKGEKGADQYNGLKAYAQSKLANVLFTESLAKRYPSISSNCLHPGVVRTRIGNKSTKWYFSLLWSLYKPFAAPPHCAARTSVYLATSPEVKEVSGRYFDQRQCCKKPSKLARNQELAERLWTASEQFVAEA